MRQVSVIPALPGWYVLVPIFILEEDKIHSFEKEPILAWRIEIESRAPPYQDENFSEVYPVTLQSVSDDAVLRPDGIIVFLDEITFHSEQEAIEYLNGKPRKKGESGKAKE